MKITDVITESIGGAAGGATIGSYWGFTGSSIGAIIAFLFCLYPLLKIKKQRQAHSEATR